MKSKAQIAVRNPSQARRNPMTPLALDEMTDTVFQNHTGSAFTLKDGADNTVQLVLNEVVSGTNRPASWMKRDPFKLWFDGPSDPTIPSNVYTLSHPDLGTIGDVLVTPVFDPEKPGVPTYEVVFN